MLIAALSDGEDGIGARDFQSLPDGLIVRLELSNDEHYEVTVRAL